jgi:SAM-dependent methyltransferase
MPSIDWNRSAWPEQFAAHDSKKSIYGYEWGDPNNREILMHVRDRFILPYVNRERTALEIGPGGGRWSQFLTGFRKLYLVDLNECFFESLKQRYPGDNVVCLRTNGSDLAGIEDGSLNFIFSFGAFVHIDPADIEGYLDSIKRKLAAGGVVALHYSDKTKPLGLKEAVFSYNTPDLMRSLVRHHGFSIAEEDLTTLPHSSIIRFCHGPASVEESGTGS